MKRPGVRIPLPPAPKAFGAVAPESGSCRTKVDLPGLVNANAANYDSAGQFLNMGSCTYVDVCKAIPSERIQQISDIASDLTRCSSEEFAVAASERSKPRASFLLESD